MSAEALPQDEVDLIRQLQDRRDYWQQAGVTAQRTVDLSRRYFEALQEKIDELLPPVEVVE
jgi:hypothetical protein